MAKLLIMQAMEMIAKGGLGSLYFSIKRRYKAIKNIWVKGKVFDKKTLAGLPSAVELTDIKSRNIISKVQTDEDGNYLITLPVGKDYAFNVNRKGYLFYSDNFSLLNNNIDSVFTVKYSLATH